MQYRLLLSVLILIGTTGLALAGPQGELPDGPGRDEVVQNCTACHTQAIILQNRMTRDAWDHTITWMQEKQGLWELDTDTRKQILDYLSTHMGPQGGGGDKGPQRRKMYQYDYKPNPL